jgi:NAD(P)-dependent dehydrogenase (short-subunit alcohol dehydrogenase family)
LAPAGVTVTALHVGFMDTDMVADVDAPKEDPAAVAAAALDGVENGLVEVLVGDRTRQVKAGLAADRGPSGQRSNRAVRLKRNPIRQIRRRHDSATSPNTVLNRRSTTQVSIDLPGPLRLEVPT